MSDKAKATILVKMESFFLQKQRYNIAFVAIVNYMLIKVEDLYFTWSQLKQKRIYIKYILHNRATT